jgi:hypothetical protein
MLIDIISRNNALLLLLPPRGSACGANMLRKSAEDADMMGTDTDATTAGEGVGCVIEALLCTADPPALPVERLDTVDRATTSRSADATDDGTSESSSDPVVGEDDEIKSPFFK